MLVKVTTVAGDGRRLSRQLTALVSRSCLGNDFLAFCAFGPAGNGIAALVHGDVTRSSSGRCGGVVIRTPLLADRVIGWVAGTIAAGRLSVTAHFVDRRPSGKRFRTSFDHEVARLARMLGVGVGSVS